MDYRYRYTLYRDWHPGAAGCGRFCGWVCLNPSTADAQVEDATTRRLRGFSERWGFHNYILVNLYPLRATSPKDLLAATAIDRMGDPRLADEAVRAMTHDCDEIVLAWGSWGAHETVRDRVAEICEFIAEAAAKRHIPVWTLGLTKEGQPRHPLRLAYTTPRERWAPEGGSHVR